VWWQPGILIAFGIWLLMLSGITWWLLWWGRKQIDKFDQELHELEKKIVTDDDTR